MYQRTDGIVEFDSEVCIGCKACMQACPYDAIHIDPTTKTAAKCHYCAHRVETGMEPACVVVCPTHSIIAGDLDDPTSEIGRAMAQNEVSVRKPEQNTDSNLFYVEGNGFALHPPEETSQDTGMIFTEVLKVHGQPNPDPYLGSNGPVQVIGGEVHLQMDGFPSEVVDDSAPGVLAEHMVQSVYNAQHKTPWHWQVPAYLLTKGVGAGLFLLLGLAHFLDWFIPAGNEMMMAGGLGIVGVVATTVLLVADLERPERFLRILFRPQWKSWLTRGAFILVAFTHVALGWWGCEVAAHLGWLSADLAATARPYFAAITLPLAIGTGVYTAFLFAQCEGRDLWQNPLVPLHMCVQVLMLGAAGLLLVGIGGGPASQLLLTMLVIDLLIIVVGEFVLAPATRVADAASHLMTRGPYRGWFWVGAMLLGHLVPVLVLVMEAPGLDKVAALITMLGLYAYEHAFVMAAQDIPNS